MSRSTTFKQLADKHVQGRRSMAKVKFECDLDAGETLIISASLEEGVFMYYPDEDTKEEPEGEDSEPIGEFKGLSPVFRKIKRSTH